MAYQTGTAIDGSNFLSILNTFAVANGWTSNRNTSTDVNLSKGSLYENINWDGVDDIRFKAATGFDVGQAYNNQPGQAIDTQLITNMQGSYTAYHLFTDAIGDYIHCVIEVDPNWYRHFAFGILEKCSTYTGGEYSCAIYQALGDAWTGTNVLKLFASGVSGIGPENSTGVIRGDIDAISDTWLSTNYILHHGNRRGIGTDTNMTTASFNSNYADWHEFYRDWRIYSPNTINAITTFAPIHFFADRTNGLWSPMGHVKDVRTCVMNSFTPSEEVVLGADTWIVFPGSAKSDSYSADVSYNHGYAYKKII